MGDAYFHTYTNMGMKSKRFIFVDLLYIANQLLILSCIGAKFPLIELHSNGPESHSTVVKTLSSIKFQPCTLQ